MRRLVSVLPTSLLAACATWMLAAPAAALEGDGSETGVAACGNIDVKAEAECKVEVGAECVANCTPVHFEAACAGRCESSPPTVTCEGTCQSECKGTCEVDPGNFDCEANCSASCEGNCAAKCEASNDKASCEGTCKSSCSGECQGKCEATPPEATCEGKCEASCQGSCTVEAHTECDISCKSELQGGCEVKCDDPEGALFCDSQYVDAGNNLNDCVNALNAFLASHVETSGSAECNGASCEAEGEATVTCSMGAGRAASSGLGLLGAAVAAGLAVSRRRRFGSAS